MLWFTMYSIYPGREKQLKGLTRGWSLSALFRGNASWGLESRREACELGRKLFTGACLIECSARREGYPMGIGNRSNSKQIRHVRRWNIRISDIWKWNVPIWIKSERLESASRTENALAYDRVALDYREQNSTETTASRRIEFGKVKESGLFLGSVCTRWRVKSARPWIS